MKYEHFSNADTGKERPCQFSDHAQDEKGVKIGKECGATIRAPVYGIWVCTRPPNHTGPHEARNSRGACARWTDETKAGIELASSL